VRGDGRVISNTNNDDLFHIFNEVMLQGIQTVVSNLATLSFNNSFLMSNNVRKRIIVYFHMDVKLILLFLYSVAVLLLFTSTHSFLLA
jgi:hypothetical protein